MAYEIEFEDKGQDLLRLTVDEDTALITDSGLLSWEFATGRYEVIVGDLLVDRVVHFRKDGGEVQSFNYLMAKLSRNGEVLAQAA